MKWDLSTALQEPWKLPPGAAAMSVTFEITKMGMKLGTTLKIKGKFANDADGFVIDLGQGPEKIDLHFNPRFSQGFIACNSWGGSWGREQRENHLGFGPRSEVKLTVRFECCGFNVKLPDGYQFTFPLRMGSCCLSYLRVKDGLSFTSLKFE